MIKKGDIVLLPGDRENHGRVAKVRSGEDGNRELFVRSRSLPSKNGWYDESVLTEVIIGDTTKAQSDDVPS